MSHSSVCICHLDLFIANCNLFDLPQTRWLHVLIFLCQHIYICLSLFIFPYLLVYLYFLVSVFVFVCVLIFLCQRYLYLLVYLYFIVSISIFVCVPIFHCQRIYICLCSYISLSAYIYLLIYLHIFVGVFVFPWQRIYICLCTYISLSANLICLCICISLSANLFVYLYFLVSVFVSACLFSPQPFCKYRFALFYTIHRLNMNPLCLFLSTRQTWKINGSFPYPPGNGQAVVLFRVYPANVVLLLFSLSTR